MYENVVDKLTLKPWFAQTTGFQRLHTIPKTFSLYVSAPLVHEERRLVLRGHPVGGLHLLPGQAPRRPNRRPGHREPEALVPLRRVPPLAHAASLQPLLQGDVRPDDAVLEPGAGRETEVLRDPAVPSEQVHRLLRRLKSVSGTDSRPS